MNNKNNAIENRDCSKIDKLNKITDIKTFWDDVRKITRNVTSNHSIGRWQCLAEIRFNELLTGYEDVFTEIEYGKPTRYFDRLTDKEVYPIDEGSVVLR